MRIINIVENLDKGAVENWLVNIFIESRKHRPEWQWTFYCILNKEGKLDSKVRQAGGEIIYAPCSVSNKKYFISALRKTLKQGRYDIIHSHHDYLSGFYLLATYNIPFKKRILHIHNTDAALPVGNKMLHNLLLAPFAAMAIHFSDIIVGISNDTLHQFTKGKKILRKVSEVLYYGIDMNRFESDTELQDLRNSFNVPSESKLILFSGRMNEQKNPVFVIDILQSLLKKDKRYFAVFVGEGDLLKEVETKAKAYGIFDHIRLLGWRNDLSSIMKACDIFVFPREENPKEGLGLVVVEAQAAGMPMVLSHGIVEDAIEIPELAHFKALNNDPQEWADIILNIRETINKKEALHRMKQSKFALPVATQNLIKLYEN